MTWFSGARSPDESVFQTLIARTSRLEKVAFNALANATDPIRANRHALHYVDFSVTNPPKLLTLEDLPAICAGGALFARKVSLARSAPLLDALDQEARSKADKASRNGVKPTPGKQCCPPFGIGYHLSFHSAPMPKAKSALAPWSSGSDAPRASTEHQASPALPKTKRGRKWHTEVARCCS